jgi:fumarate hydratase class II
MIHAVAVLKSAAATANEKCGKLDHKRAELIRKVCKEITDCKLEDNFPTYAYQAGSGTQTNMNVNEVVANRANKITNTKLIHPNDHVNMSQSTNDVYPSAMNITAISLIHEHLLPPLDRLIKSMKKLQIEGKSIVKMGRTHIQDALPITFGEEVSG